MKLPLVLTKSTLDTISVNYFCLWIYFSLYSTHDKCGFASAKETQVLPFQKPTIRVGPRNHFSVDGILEFTCLAVGYPKPTITWYNSTDGLQLNDRSPSETSISGIHINPFQGRLMISNPVRGIIYSVFCNVSNELGWVISDPPAQGAASFLEPFRTQASNLTLKNGDPLVLNFGIPKGIPEPDIIWMFDGNIIAHRNKTFLSKTVNFRPRKSRTRVADNGSLIITSVQTTDSGTYQCIAFNVAGQRKSSILVLNVIRTERFAIAPKSTRVQLGELASFDCSAEGNHPIQWKRAPNEGQFDPTRTVITGTQLQIRNTLMSDAGSYLCEIPGSATATVKLIVDKAPTFSEKPKDLKILAGETAVFGCLATGTPTPAVYWKLPNNVPVFFSESLVDSTDLKYVVNKNGTLIIRRTNKHDEGIYMCTAHSSIDAIHAGAQLMVQETSSHNISSPESRIGLILPPVIALPQRNITALFGSDILLTCVVHKNHNNQSIRWDHLTSASQLQRNQNVFEPVNGYRFTVLSNGSLQISQTHFDDAGEYRCIVINHLKDGTKTFEFVSDWVIHLTVTSKTYTLKTQDIILPPPTNLHVSDIGATFMILRWEQPTMDDQIEVNQQKSVAYLIEYYSPETFNSTWKIISCNWPLNFIQLRNLMPNKQYYFVIRSRWNNGTVGWTDFPFGPISTLTASSTVDSNTKKLSIEENIGFPSLRVTDLSDTSVKLDWEIFGSRQRVKSIDSYFIHYRELALSDCPCQVSYSWHHTTVPLAQTTEKPRVHTSNDHVITLSRSVNLLINEYDRDWVILKQSHILHNLSMATCYEISIQLISENLFEESIDTVFSTTGHDLAIPNNVQVQWIDNYHANVTWNLSRQKTLMTMGFAIYLKEENANSSKTWHVNGPSIRSFIITDLDRLEAHYSVQVAVVSCIETGKRSRPVVLSGLNIANYTWMNYFTKMDFQYEPWFILLIACGLLFWCTLLIALLVMWYVNCKQRSSVFRPSYLNKTSGYSGVSQETHAVTNTRGRAMVDTDVKKLELDFHKNSSLSNKAKNKYHVFRSAPSSFLTHDTCDKSALSSQSLSERSSSQASCAISSTMEIHEVCPKDVFVMSQFSRLSQIAPNNTVKNYEELVRPNCDDLHQDELTDAREVENETFSVTQWYNHPLGTTSTLVPHDVLHKDKQILPVKHHSNVFSGQSLMANFDNAAIDSHTRGYNLPQSFLSEAFKWNIMDSVVVADPTMSQSCSLSSANFEQNLSIQHDQSKEEIILGIFDKYHSGNSDMRTTSNELLKDDSRSAMCSNEDILAKTKAKDIQDDVQLPNSELLPNFSSNSFLLYTGNHHNTPSLMPIITILSEPS